MMTIKKMIFCVSLLSCTTIVTAQNQVKTSAPKRITETSKMYAYRFEGKISSVEIETLKEDILKMNFVKEVKVEYKPEKSAGQVRLITLEKFTSVDLPFQFSILGLKELLISKNLFPEEYRSEVISEK